MEGTMSTSTPNPGRRPPLRIRAAATREHLVALFPKAFMPKGADKIPLKIGIHADIRARDPSISGVKLGAALHDYVTGPKYLRALVAGAPRLDLDGQPAGEVTERDELNAKLQLADFHFRGLLHKRIGQLREALKPLAAITTTAVDEAAGATVTTLKTLDIVRARRALEETR